MAEIINCAGSVLKKSLYRSISVNSLHLTLCFIGNVDSNLEYVIADKLKLIAAKFKAFDIEMAGVDLFKQARQRYALVLKVTCNEILHQLFSEIHLEISDLPLKIDAKIFRPHITIGKGSNWEGIKELVDVHCMSDVVPNSEKIHVKSLALFRSKITSRGAEYTIVESFELL